MPRDVLSRRRALQAAHGAGKETEHVRHGGQFVQQHGVERLAAVVRLQASEHVRLGIDALGKLELAIEGQARSRPCGCCQSVR